MKVREVWRYQGKKAAGRAKILVEVEDGDQLRPQNGLRLPGGLGEVTLMEVAIKDQLPASVEPTLAWLEVYFAPAE